MTAVGSEDGAASRSTLGLVLLVCLPAAVILLNGIAWVTALSRSGFWADDFLNLTHFSHSLGNLSDNHINEGKYIINIFWAIGTLAFGAGSVVPFLLVNALVFAAGLFLWLHAGSRARWRPVDSWWIAGLFIATAAWLPTVLWSSNITHSGGFLALGAGLAAHERCVRATTFRSGAAWSATCGVAWMAGVLSNLIYLGLLAIAAYCAYLQVVKLHELGAETRKAASAVVGWSLGLPIIYFFAVAYPGATSSPVYATNGLGFLHENLRYYRETLASTTLLTIFYVALLVAAAVGAILAARRRDLFPLAVLVAAAGTALPALVQSQQREIHYVAMPLLLTFSALAAGARPLWRARAVSSRWARGGLAVSASAMLLMVFVHASNLRTFFVSTPYGWSLTTFRSGVASLTAEGAIVCARLNLSPQGQTLFIAEMSGTNGFAVPPISASGAYLASGTQHCPAGTTIVTVNFNPRGGFVASG